MPTKPQGGPEDGIPGGANGGYRSGDPPVVGWKEDSGATGADRNTVRRIVRFAQDAGIQGNTPWPDENKLQAIRQGPSEMTKIEPWTQEELEERRQSELRQSEASSSWYSLTLKIGVAVLLAGGLVALL
jgi:hypothetical protein